MLRRLSSLSLGIIVAAYAGARLVVCPRSTQSTTIAVGACQAVLCDERWLLAPARHQLWQEADVARALPLYSEALRRNPASPYRWADLGDVLWQVGDLERARYCFERAVRRAPHLPAILYRVGGFYYGIGDEQSALRLLRRTLARVRDYDAWVFRYYSCMHASLEEILEHGLPVEAGAAESFLRYQLAHGSSSDVQTTWEWLRSHDLESERLRGQYGGL